MDEIGDPIIILDSDSDEDNAVTEREPETSLGVQLANNVAEIDTNKLSVISECGGSDDFPEFPEFQLSPVSTPAIITRISKNSSIINNSSQNFMNKRVKKNQNQTIPKTRRVTRAANLKATTQHFTTKLKEFEIYDKPISDVSNTVCNNSREPVSWDCQIVNEEPSTSTALEREIMAKKKNWTNDGGTIVIDSDIESELHSSYSSSESSNSDSEIETRRRKKQKQVSKISIYDESEDENCLDKEPCSKRKKTLRNKIYNNSSNNGNGEFPREDYNDDLNYEWGLKDLSCVMNDNSLAPVGAEAWEKFRVEKLLTNEALEELHKSLISCPKRGTKAPNPKGLKAVLMPHQQHALAWLVWREQQVPSGGLLADDMGLGKTIMMIALILATTEEKINEFDYESSEQEFDELGEPEPKPKHPKGGTLIVCPLSLLKQWEAEVKTHCKHGSLTVKIYHGGQRKIEARHLAKFSIVLTTYHSLVKEHKTKSNLFKINWKRVILDEGHYVRNPTSLACKAVCSLTSERRWTLTGTPLHNKEKDLYAILKFLKCKPFDDIEIWRHWVNSKNEAGSKRLLLIMKTLMLRRTKLELQKKGYMPTLPQKFLEVVEIELDEEEQIVYEKILEYTQSMFLLFMEQRAKHGNSNYGRVLTSVQRSILTSHLNRARIKMVEILVLYLRLRQVCCHPALVLNWLFQNGQEEEDDEEGVVPQAPIRTFDNVDLLEDISPVDNPVFQDHRPSSKIRAVLEGIEKIMNAETVDNIKIVVVSQWTSMLRVVASHLSKMPGVTYASFTGKVAPDDRQTIVDRFNDPCDELNILLLSLTAGGVGLNLIGANHLFLIDNHWNPQLERQAEDRIYRYGQTKDVHIYRYICKMTIEEKVSELQKQKLEMAHKILTGTRKVSSKLTIRDFKFLFGLESPNDNNDPEPDETDVD